MIKIAYVLVLYIVMLTGIIAVEAHAEAWRLLDYGAKSRIFEIEICEEENSIYVLTSDGIFVVDADNGEEGQKVFLPDAAKNVSGITKYLTTLYLTAESGVYKKESKGNWKRLSTPTGASGIVHAGEGNFLLWGGQGLYRINGMEFTEIGGTAISGEIIGVDARGKIIAVYSSKGLYISRDSGKNWVKCQGIETGSGGVAEETEIEDEDEPQAQDMEGMVRIFDGQTVVITGKNIYYIGGDDGVTDISPLGVQCHEITDLYYDQAGIFISNSSSILRYDPKGKAWEEIGASPHYREITSISTYGGKSGALKLFVSSGQRLYCMYLGDNPEGSASGYIGGKIPAEDAEISVREVQKMAIEYAEVSPEKIKNWRRDAKWRAALPKVSLNFSESNSGNTEIYTSSTTAYIVEGPDKVDNDWGVDFTWDLAELVWNDAQTSIDVRSKLMVELREEILEEVTRLYFERKRVLMEIKEMTENMSKDSLDSGEDTDKTNKELAEKKMRLEELTAYIDSNTNGCFSEALRGKGQGS